VEGLAAEGAAVVVFDRSDAGERVAAGLREGGADVRSVSVDLSDEESVRSGTEHVAASLGRIDTVIGCAGISGPVGRRLDEIAVEDWDAVMAVNVRGNFLVTKHAAKHLAASSVGTVVYLASDSAFVAFDGMAPYSASKGAVVMLTKAVSVDFRGIRANALCPGVVDTPMSRADLGMRNGFDGSGYPVMAPSQVAGHALFLASPVSAPINGTTLVSDFGYLARSALGALDFDGAT
jgi:dihydroanticapsin dehydrogenase